MHTLAQHNLVDEYSLLVYPLALGNGEMASDELRGQLKTDRHKELSHRGHADALSAQPGVTNRQAELSPTG